MATTSKFRGALIGVLVGDCFGAPFERISANPASVLEIIERMSKDEQNVLSYTDDTAMTIATCESLIRNKGLDSRDLSKEYSETYFKDPNRGYGAAVRTVFKSLETSKFQDPYGPAASQFNGSGSFGNGAAMRCAGVGLFANKTGLDEQKTIDLTEKCSRITHSHKHGLNGANLIILAQMDLLNMDPDSLDETKFLESLISRISKYEESNNRVYSDKLKSILGVIERLNISGLDINQSEIVSLLGNDVAAQNSVPLAIYSFLRGVSKFTDSYKIDNEFLRTLHWAISCGGDTDTIASMACGLCGAYLGIERIPADLYKRCEAHQKVLSLADKILAL
uniref:ADP-ribosylhydrolase ARH3 n=1 Tax=Aceria tosichella TaxID=561515 RepID=A0A6G1SE58_9ACAR